MKNTGLTTLICIVAGQRLAHDISDYPKQNKRLYRNNGACDLVNLNEVSPVNIGEKA